MRENKMKNKAALTLTILFFSLVVSISIAQAQIASGGQFALQQSVVAGGGIQNANGGQFAVDGTAGQSIAGQVATNSAFSVYAGFWNPNQFTPTAAAVTVSGRVTTESGRGIRNVRITITGADGEARTVLSGAFGYFRFNDVPAGETYIFNVSAKRFHFSQATQIRTILEEIDDIVFVADNDGVIK